MRDTEHAPCYQPCEGTAGTSSLGCCANGWTGDVWTCVAKHRVSILLLWWEELMNRDAQSSSACCSTALSQNCGATALAWASPPKPTKPSTLSPFQPFRFPFKPTSPTAGVVVGPTVPACCLVKSILLELGFEPPGLAKEQSAFVPFLKCKLNKTRHATNPKLSTDNAQHEEAAVGRNKTPRTQNAHHTFTAASLRRWEGEPWRPRVEESSSVQLAQF